MSCLMVAQTVAEALDEEMDVLEDPAGNVFHAVVEVVGPGNLTYHITVTPVDEEMHQYYHASSEDEEPDLEGL